MALNTLVVLAVGMYTGDACVDVTIGDPRADASHGAAPATHTLSPLPESRVRMFCGRFVSLFRGVDTRFRSSHSAALVLPSGVSHAVEEWFDAHVRTRDLRNTLAIVYVCAHGLRDGDTRWFCGGGGHMEKVRDVEEYLLSNVAASVVVTDSCHMGVPEPRAPHEHVQVTVASSQRDIKARQGDLLDALEATLKKRWPPVVSLYTVLQHTREHMGMRGGPSSAVVWSDEGHKLHSAISKALVWRAAPGADMSAAAEHYNELHRFAYGQVRRSLAERDEHTPPRAVTARLHNFFQDDARAFRGVVDELASAMHASEKRRVLVVRGDDAAQRTSLAARVVKRIEGSRTVLVLNGRTRARFDASLGEYARSMSKDGDANADTMRALLSTEQADAMLVFVTDVDEDAREWLDAMRHACHTRWEQRVAEADWTSPEEVLRHRDTYNRVVDGMVEDVRTAADERWADTPRELWRSATRFAHIRDLVATCGPHVTLVIATSHPHTEIIPPEVEHVVHTLRLARLVGKCEKKEEEAAADQVRHIELCARLLERTPDGGQWRGFAEDVPLVGDTDQDALAAVLRDVVWETIPQEARDMLCLLAALVPGESIDPSVLPASGADAYSRVLGHDVVRMLVRMETDDGVMRVSMSDVVAGAVQQMDGWSPVPAAQMLVGWKPRHRADMMRAALHAGHVAELWTGIRDAHDGSYEEAGHVAELWTGRRDAHDGSYEEFCVFASRTLLSVERNTEAASVLAPLERLERRHAKSLHVRVAFAVAVGKLRAAERARVCADYVQLLRDIRNALLDHWAHVLMPKKDEAPSGGKGKNKLVEMACELVDTTLVCEPLKIVLGGDDQSAGLSEGQRETARLLIGWLRALFSALSSSKEHQPRVARLRMWVSHEMNMRDEYHCEFYVAKLVKNLDEFDALERGWKEGGGWSLLDQAKWTMHRAMKMCAAAKLDGDVDAWMREVAEAHALFDRAVEMQSTATMVVRGTTLQHRDLATTYEHYADFGHTRVAQTVVRHLNRLQPSSDCSDEREEKLWLLRDRACAEADRLLRLAYHLQCKAGRAHRGERAWPMGTRAKRAKALLWGGDCDRALAEMELVLSKSSSPNYDVLKLLSQVRSAVAVGTHEAVDELFGRYLAQLGDKPLFEDKNWARHIVVVKKKWGWNS